MAARHATAGSKPGLLASQTTQATNAITVKSRYITFPCHTSRRCGSAADVHASLLAGTAVRCSRLMARRDSVGQKADGNSQLRWLGAKRPSHRQCERRPIPYYRIGASLMARPFDMGLALIGDRCFGSCGHMRFQCSYSALQRAIHHATPDESCSQQQAHNQ